MNLTPTAKALLWPEGDEGQGQVAEVTQSRRDLHCFRVGLSLRYLCFLGRGWSQADPLQDQQDGNETGAAGN